jgi:small-conductance mechanosensitive channel
VSSFTVTVGGVTLKLGEVLVAFVNLVVSFVLVVFTIGLLRTYVLSRIGAKRAE